MRHVKLMIGIFCVVLLQMATTNVGAENRAGAVSISPFVGWYMFEGNQNVDDDITWGGSLGYLITESWAVEGVFQRLDTELDDRASSELDVNYFHLDALYHFMPSEKLVPFVAVGVGGIHYRLEDVWGENDTNWAANYGGGIKYFLTEDLALRCDVRHVLSWDGGERYNNLSCTAGITFLLGGEKPQAAAPVAPVEVKKAPMDSDGDGVCDDLDKCPGTPKGVKVDKDGCPLDTDGDGVPDYLDKCPNTPKGATVDEFGCWVCKNLNFDFNKWDIKPQYHACLDEGVDYLKNEQPNMKVEIQGHTDNIGSQKYNQMLSEKRAMAVRDYLIRKGIAKERLIIKGYGFSKPVTTNDTEEGRAKNRRVQFEQITK